MLYLNVHKDGWEVQRLYIGKQARVVLGTRIGMAVLIRSIYKHKSPVEYAALAESIGHSSHVIVDGTLVISKVFDDSVMDLLGRYRHDPVLAEVILTKLKMPRKKKSRPEEPKEPTYKMPDPDKQPMTWPVQS